MTQKIGFEVSLTDSMDDSIARVTEALKAEGFGVLTRIDVKATLKTKLDVDFRPYVILGACNPSLAYQALSSQPEVGLMLPCNVTMEADSEGGSIVRIIDPNLMMGVGFLGDNAALRKAAAQAHQKLARVAQSLEN